MSVIMGMTGRPPLPTVVVAQDGSGDYNGTTEKPIQDAIDSLGTSGGWVYIKPGTYDISNTIVIDASSVILSGSTHTSRLAVAPAANCDILELHTNAVTVYDLYFFGKRSMQTSSSSCIYLNKPNYCTLYNLYFYDFYTHAITGETMSSFIYNCLFYDTGSNNDTIYLEPLYSSLITSCIFLAPTKSGIHLHDSDFVTINSCIFWGGSASNNTCIELSGACRKILVTSINAGYVYNGIVESDNSNFNIFDDIIIYAQSGTAYSFVGANTKTGLLIP